MQRQANGANWTSTLQGRVSALESIGSTIVALCVGAEHPEYIYARDTRSSFVWWRKPSEFGLHGTKQLERALPAVNVFTHKILISFRRASKEEKIEIMKDTNR